MKKLLDIGFQCVGHWKLNDDRPVFELTSQMNARNILYAFVSNREIKYIGQTTQSLKGRMSSYQNPGPTQSTNIKNNEYIRELLNAGEAVDIFALPDSGLLHYGQFHINLAAGLEDSLISVVSPPWNGGRITKSNQGGGADSPETSPEPSTSESKQSAEPQETKREGGGVTFRFHVRKTYFNQGFFNVPVAHQHVLGNDRDKIEIYCGQQERLVQGYINRSVNLNNTPRIMGGASLRQWFQENCKVDCSVEVEVLAPTSIWLRRSGA